MHAPGVEDDQYVLAFLDTEQAFDSLNFEYVWQVLEKMGLGHNFIKWVKLVYTNPGMRVRKGHAKSQWKLFCSEDGWTRRAGDEDLRPGGPLNTAGSILSPRSTRDYVAGAKSLAERLLATEICIPVVGR
ncbi:hypothetical protein NDU88_007601 [Pleurodeles waltl]|uniref:Reverse transcriptase domain-containing protein n=1 Tax=Pleurodeles waltl TaxID=8319 RepID=A0AAV7RV85_PLEWA|nr:hypothetical protein NDU88_007601 [Pleurodeles waltl]